MREPVIEIVGGDLRLGAAVRLHVPNLHAARTLFPMRASEARKKNGDHPNPTCRDKAPAQAVNCLDK